NFWIGWYCRHAIAPSQFGRFLTLCNSEDETTIHVSPLSFLRSKHAHTNLPGRVTCTASDPSLLEAHSHIQLPCHQRISRDNAVYKTRELPAGRSLQSAWWHQSDFTTEQGRA